jgi:rSAM/selenodomain-associated transferase 2
VCASETTLGELHRPVALTHAFKRPTPQNEECNVGAAVRSALGASSLTPSTSSTSSTSFDPPSIEVIVVDGHSHDGTVREARQAGATVLRASKPGRAGQMNQGANAAKGDVIMFLHADSTLPADYTRLVEASIGREKHQWGSFRSIDIGIKNPLGSFLIKQGVALRTRLLHKPYGDQCIFVRRKTFTEVGGYKDMPLLEDVDLVTRLSAHAGPPSIIERDLKTSGRRWQSLGILRTTMLNQYILLRHAMGADLNALAKLYSSGGQMSR